MFDLFSVAVFSAYLYFHSLPQEHKKILTHN